MEHMDEDKAIRNFIIIFIIVILAVVGIYFFTKLVVNKDESNSTSTDTKEIEINNSVAIVGTMLGKAEDHYYVILYRSEEYAPVAQLDRAFGYEPKGREFESLRA